MSGAIYNFIKVGSVEKIQVKPLKAFFQKGLTTRDELIGLTRPLGSYLEERGFTKDGRIYASLFKRFPDEIIPISQLFNQQPEEKYLFIISWPSS